jgi:hypothetical protein
MSFLGNLALVDIHFAFILDLNFRFKIKVFINDFVSQFFIQFQFDLTPSSSLIANDMTWRYFSKNLSTIPFFSNGWNTGMEWQVKTSDFN